MIKGKNIKVGITIGDLNGIGMEVIIKGLKRLKSIKGFTPIVYGNAKSASFYLKSLHEDEFRFNFISNAESAKANKPNLVTIDEAEIRINPGEPSAETGQYAAKSIQNATDDLASGKLDVIVTCPIDKNTIQGSGFNFTGHTEFFTNYSNVDDSLMLMVSNGLRIGTVTNHVSVKNISTELTAEKIHSKVEILLQSLVKDFGVSKPKIAILGLNPHAGDNGLIGDEETTLIKPIIKELQEKGKLVFGPYAADGFFGAGDYKNFDAVIAMYHDQGLIPFKSLSFGSGVNYTAGLPIVRTSVDHGTGYNIAGANEASSQSFIQAIFLGCDIFRNRQEYKELTQNPLQSQKVDAKGGSEMKDLEG